MVIQSCDDFLLKEVAYGLEALVSCYLQSPLPSSPSHSSEMLQSLLDWLVLLHCRSKDVLLEFSGYYCLRLLLDIESPLATYFIDLFHQLEWLLETMRTHGATSSSAARMPLPEELRRHINALLCSIKPATNSCRYIIAVSRSSPSACSQWLSADREMKREAKAYRDFSRDEDRALTKMMSYTNLDQSRYNNIKLGRMLGSGSFADVYEGNFLAWNHSDQASCRIGQPVAVKVFRNGEFRTDSMGSCKSVSQEFFHQMEKMLELKRNAQNTSYMTDTEVLLSEELWLLVSAKHPNIVAARGHIGKRPEGDSGLVMEMMDTSLQDYLKEVGRPLEEVEMIDLMLEIAKGMRFLHECALLHKDLNPRNILLRSQKGLGVWENYPATEVKLADFGLTERIVQDMQESMVDLTTAGTLCYMAPEVLHKADYKASHRDKVDVFSYGTICFNILTCEDPDARKFTSARTRAEADLFYEGLTSNQWRKWVKHKPEYLVDLVARCWNFDSSQRPTFATICSLLQRAMLCMFSPPVINVTALSMFQENSNHSLLNLYKTITWSSDVLYEVIGTPMMDSCLEALARDINEFGRMRSNLSEDAALFLEAWNKIAGLSNARTRKGVGVSSSKQSEAVASEELFAAIEERIGPDGSEYVSTPSIRVEVQDRYFRIPFRTMAGEWIVFKALVCSSVLSQFPFLDHGYFIQPLLGHDGQLKTPQEKAAPLKPFPFKNDSAKSELHVDENLIPFLMCFCEKSILPDYASLFRRAEEAE